MPASVLKSLVCHPTSPTAGIVVQVAVARTPAALSLSFRIRGNPDSIIIPPPQPAGPADGLWRHTCCEAFVAAADSAGYREFNFSPSGQWACYHFADYRQPDPGFRPDAPLPFDFRREPDAYVLEARLPAALQPTSGTLRLGLTAVVEHADGEKSYWALAHCAEQPDFHLCNSFILTLSPP